MVKQRAEIVFSLTFFFFASFLFLVIISSKFIANFENLLPIMLKQGGLFVTLSRIILVCGIILAIYLFSKQKSNKNRYFNIFGLFMFGILLISSMLPNGNNDEFNNIINIYNYKETNILLSNIKNLAIDNIIFICFILIPIFKFFDKKHSYDNYFYKNYIQELTPLLNTIIIFLFGYSIRIYSANLYSIASLCLNIVFIVIILRIAFILKNTISFYAIMNILILIIGLIIFLFSGEILLRGNIYYIGLFFYCIGLLYWFLNNATKKSSLK